MSQATHCDRSGSLPRHRPTLVVDNVEPGAIASSTGWRFGGAEVQHAQPCLTSMVYGFDPGGRQYLLRR